MRDAQPQPRRPAPTRRRDFLRGPPRAALRLLRPDPTPTVLVAARASRDTPPLLRAIDPGRGARGLRACEPTRVAGPVDSLAVLRCDGRHRFQAADPAQDPTSQIRIHPQPLPF